MAVSGGLRGVRVCDGAEPEGGDRFIRRAKAIDHEDAVRIDDVAAAIRIGLVAIDDIEAIDGRDDLEPSGGAVADDDAIALAILANDERATAGGVAGQGATGLVDQRERDRAVTGVDLERLRIGAEVRGVRGGALRVVVVEEDLGPWRANGADERRERDRRGDRLAPRRAEAGALGGRLRDRATAIDRRVTRLGVGRDVAAGRVGARRSVGAVAARGGRGRDLLGAAHGARAEDEAKQWHEVTAHSGLDLHGGSFRVGREVQRPQCRPSSKNMLMSVRDGLVAREQGPPQTAGPAISGACASSVRKSMK
ncbi:hypothetical protein BH09PAT4_BH09PAT4_09350 [soil metagenome]